MGFIAAVNLALMVLAWSIWGFGVLVIVTSVLVSKFKEACKAYYEYKLAMYRELHRQSQEDADEVSSLLWK